MKAILVKEYLNKTPNTENFSEGKSLGEEKCMKIVKKYFPFISKIYFDDLGDREDGGYGQDEQYAKWDQLTVITGNKDIDEDGLSLYLIQELNNDKIYAKFYFDAVCYTGYGEINDEYVNESDAIAVEEWDKERYESVIEDIKDNNRFDEDDEE